MQTAPTLVPQIKIDKHFQFALMTQKKPREAAAHANCTRQDIIIKATLIETNPYNLKQHCGTVTHANATWHATSDRNYTRLNMYMHPGQQIT